MATDIGSLLAVPTGGASAIAGWATSMALDAATAYRDYKRVEKAVEEGDVKTLRDYLDVSDITNMIYGDGSKGDVSMPANSALRVNFEKAYPNINSLVDNKKSELPNAIKLASMLPSFHKTDDSYESPKYFTTHWQNFQLLSLLRHFFC